jgi:hypothetical protein
MKIPDDCTDAQKVSLLTIALKRADEKILNLERDCKSLRRSIRDEAQKKRDVSDKLSLVLKVARLLGHDLEQECKMSGVAAESHLAARAAELCSTRACPHCGNRLTLWEALAMVRGDESDGVVQVRTPGGTLVFLELDAVNPATMEIVTS